jgi:CRISPR-associated endonuclease/helicase Cas3
MGNHKRLLAKSARRGIPGQSIRVHTAAVIRTGERLVEATGKAQLGALGLDPASWLERFRREIKLAALLHDLGKANDHFQEMIQGETTRRQGLRHEAVSYWIARRPEMRDWVRPVQANSRAVELILWAIAGHHRKFPPTDPPEDAKPELTVYLRHTDFREVLELGVAELGLGMPPVFSSDGRLKMTRFGSVLREFDDSEEEARMLMASLSEEEVRYVALLKACLICADVAGSIERRGTQSIADWIVEAFRRVPAADELESIVLKKLKGKT